MLVGTHESLSSILLTGKFWVLVRLTRWRVIRARMLDDSADGSSFDGHVHGKNRMRDGFCIFSPESETCHTSIWIVVELDDGPFHRRAKVKVVHASVFKARSQGRLRHEWLPLKLVGGVQSLLDILRSGSSSLHTTVEHTLQGTR